MLNTWMMVIEGWVGDIDILSTGGDSLQLLCLQVAAVGIFGMSKNVN